MRNEQAKREIDSLDFYLQNHIDDYSEASHTAMMMAKKALDQYPILDKVIDEVQGLRGCSCSCSDGIIDDVEDIINKYNAEVKI